MVKVISRAKAKNYMQQGWYRRVEDDLNGRGERAIVKRVKVEPHSTYFKWVQIEPVEQSAKCYYDTCNSIEAVMNNRGDIERIVFKYARHMVCYEREK